MRERSRGENREPAAGDANRGLTASDANREPAASDANREPAASDANRGLTASDANRGLTASDANRGLTASGDRSESFLRNRRGLSSVVGKLYELAIVLGFVGVVTAALYGSVVPGYRTATGAELGDRALVTAAERVEAAVPPSGVTGRRTLAADLPATLAGEPYRIRAVNDSALVLEHPAEAVGGRVPLALPARVRRVNGTWNSTDRPVVVVVDRADGVRIRLEARR